ncbi:class II fructose-1,6-bisphosphate aldolase [Salibacterium halotolerans]|uniref:Fructose-bisphosphate aldolase, class II n=1 Tax=Salibacterium halotolerans TaxID=1884432 RepID=A0A1I5V4A9_9BACI|nr:class II fructose-1,6-bisphosphate aldolase [Salibacterium halotolerans]SFQ02328.1 fructose-bisphosphate aldolase, class II [Salibacterium halotolerans]
MPLVSMKEMLHEAKADHYAVGQYNLNNMEFIQAVLQAAQEERSPLICGVSEGSARYMSGFKPVVDMVKTFMEAHHVTVPVAVHLDHGSSFEVGMEAIRAGFTSVMIDGSSYPLEENIALTSRVVEAAHAVGVSVEAELGRIGGQEDDTAVEKAEESYAVSSECKKFVEETEADCLAPALGFVHAPYKRESHLGFDRMKEIDSAVGVPLVLHGGTGIPAEDVQKAIGFGCAKINVNTESQISSAAAVRKTLEEKPELYDPRKYMGPARDAVKETVKAKMREFGSAGRV